MELFPVKAVSFVTSKSCTRLTTEPQRFMKVRLDCKRFEKAIFEVHEKIVFCYSIILGGETGYLIRCASLSRFPTGRGLVWCGSSFYDLGSNL